MATSISFNGFKNYPKGNSNIRLDNGTLVLSDSLTSTDGLIVETNGAKGFEMSFKPHTITSGEVFGSTFNIKDGLNRIKTIGQWALTLNSDEKHAYLVVNSRLMGENIQIEGRKDGRIVYSKTFVNNNRNEDPYVNWLPVIIIAAVAIKVIKDIACEKEKKVKKDETGKTTEVEEQITQSIGLNCKMIPITNPVATTNPIFDEDTLIEIDEIIISSSRFYPDEIPTELDGEIAEVIFNTNTRENIVITEEKALTE